MKKAAKPGKISNFRHHLYVKHKGQSPEISANPVRSKKTSNGAKKPFFCGLNPLEISVSNVRSYL